VMDAGSLGYACIACILVNNSISLRRRLAYSVMDAGSLGYACIACILVNNSIS